MKAKDVPSGVRFKYIDEDYREFIAADNDHLIMVKSFGKKCCRQVDWTRDSFNNLEVEILYWPDWVPRPKRLVLGSKFNYRGNEYILSTSKFYNRRNSYSYLWSWVNTKTGSSLLDVSVVHTSNTADNDVLSTLMAGMRIAGISLDDFPYETEYPI